MVVKKIMVVGCGGIGSRHLQALKKITIPIQIWAIDPNENSLNNTKKLLDEIPTNQNVEFIKFEKNLQDDNKNIDLCIIATSSDVRLNVLKDLLSKISIKNIIFEKILFQSEEQFKEAKNIIYKNKINCWVNCFRREEEYWNKVKKYFSGNTNMKLYYGKPGCNMGTNSIHIIDLAAWIFNDKIKHIDNSELEKIIFKARREGFIEFSGILKTMFENGSICEYESVVGTPREEAEFEITSDTVRLKINEAKGEGVLYRKENNWSPEKQNFYIPHQSEKTQKIAEKILINEKCELTSFEESVEIHRLLINCFLNHLNKISDTKYEYCPIT